MSQDKAKVLQMLCSRFSNVIFRDISPAQAEVITSSNSKREYYYIYGAKITTNGGSFLYVFVLTKEKKASKSLLKDLSPSSFHLRSYSTDKIESKWKNIHWDDIGDPQMLTMKAYDTFPDINVSEVTSCRKCDCRCYTSTDKSFTATLYCEPAADGDVNELPPSTTIIPAIETMDIVVEFK